MRIRTKKSHFQNLPEGSSPARFLPQLLRFFYLLLLLAILVTVCVIVVRKFLYFTGSGQVEVAKVKISSEHGGTVDALFKRKGESFTKGEILARIKREPECIERAPLEEETSVEGVGAQPTAVRRDPRIVRLQFALRQKQAELQVLDEQLTDMTIRGELEQDTALLHRALEVGDIISRKKNVELMKNSRKLRDKIKKLELEIELNKEELAALESVTQTLSMTKRPEAATIEPLARCEFEQIEATFSGQVDYVTRTSPEYIKKGEPLFVVVPENNNVVVEAYINRKNMPFLQKGKTLSIEFPDKRKSIGQVEEFVSSARYHTEKITENYIPVKTSIQITLAPVSELDRQIWRGYDRMDVKVRGERK